MGRRGEALAAEYLVERGLTLIDRNVRTRRGELDIVALDGGTLVIVEVRAVARAGFLRSLACAVTLGKARQVLRATRCYLAQRGERRRDVRIDAVGVDLSTGRVEHLPGAIRWDMELPRERRRRERGW